MAFSSRLYYLVGFTIALLSAALYTGATFSGLLITTGLLSFLSFITICRTNSIPVSKAHIFCSIGLFLAFFNIFWSSDPEHSFVSAWVLTCGIWISLLTMRQQQSSRWFPLLTIMLILTLLEACWGLLQYTTTFERASGSQIDPNVYVAFLYVGSILWLAYYINRPWKQHTFWFYAGQFILLSALMATFSRSGIGAWVIGLTILLSMSLYFKKTITPLLIYLAIAIIAYTAVKITPLMMDHNVITRHFNDLSTLNARLPQWEAGWNIFLMHPWTGTGLGTFAALYAPIRTEFISAGKLLHNDYLQILQEGGLFLGLLFLLWCSSHIWLLFKLLMNPYKAKRLNHKFELSGLVCVNLMLFAHAFINFIFYIPYLNLLAGIIFARILWLAFRCGYVARPKHTLHLSCITKSILLVSVTLLWTKLLLVGGLQVLADHTKQDQLPISPETAEYILKIDPLNSIASEVFLHSGYAALTVLPQEKRVQLWFILWDKIQSIQQRKPISPRVYYWMGMLVDRAVALHIQYPLNVKSGEYYQKQALLKDPSYMPAHIKISYYIEQQESPKNALLYLEYQFTKWFPFVKIRDTLALLDRMIYIAKEHHLPELEQIQHTRSQIDHWFQNKSVFKPRYEG